MWKSRGKQESHSMVSKNFFIIIQTLGFHSFVFVRDAQWANFEHPYRCARSLNDMIHLRWCSLQQMNMAH